jgi:hypothetical protein
MSAQLNKQETFSRSKLPDLQEEDKTLMKTKLYVIRLKRNNWYGKILRVQV